MLGFGNYHREFEQFFWEHKGLVASIVLKYTKDVAVTDDLIQEVFLKAYLKFSKIRTMQFPKAYMRAIAVTTIIDYFRKHKERLQEVGLSDEIRNKYAEEISGIERAFDSASSARTVLQIISSMPTKRGAVLSLRLIEQLSFVEIAETLHISAVSARNHYSQGIKQLRAKLDGGAL